MRYPRFSIRFLFFSTAFICIVMWLVVMPVFRVSRYSASQKNLAKQIEKMGGDVLFEFTILNNLNLRETLIAAVLGADKTVAISAIDFSGTEVCSSDLRILTAVNRCTLINLRRTEVDDEVVETLIKLPALETVDLRETAISHPAICVLRQSNPQLHVYSDWEEQCELR